MWFPGICKKKIVSWEVALWGKHRSFGDYISCGDNNRLVQRFAGWSQREKTLSAVARCVKKEQWVTWYYWLQERNRIFHCGVAMISSDRTGRPNLLILSGQGEAAGNPNNWESFSLGCRQTWQAMAAMGREDFMDFAGLQARLTELPRPRPAFSPLPLDTGRAYEAAAAAVSQTIQANRTRCLIDKTICIAGLDDSEEDLLRKQIACRQIMQIVPNSFFMGGLPGQKRLLFFFRQLDESDFINLWEAEPVSDEY